MYINQRHVLCRAEGFFFFFLRSCALEMIVIIMIIVKDGELESRKM